MEENANRKRMKIQLPLENWVDLFGLVPRLQLVELLPQIDDRHFAEALQYFLQKVGKITLGELSIIPPKRNYPNGRPMVEKRWVDRFDLADTPIPANIKNFCSIYLSYIDPSVLIFLRQFQQNSLLKNVNLSFSYVTKEQLLPFFTHVLPLIDIDSIQSMETARIRQLIQLCDDAVENNNGLSRKLKKSISQTKILDISHYSQRVEPDELDWCFRWLYTPRNDGRPRVLIFSARYCPNGISFLLDRIKQDFLNANHPIYFFICIVGYHNLRQDILLDRTNEKLSIKRINNNESLISRYPSGAEKEWIEQNEKEFLDWNSYGGRKREIQLGYFTQIAL